jgi:hypothetical protein
VLMLNRFVSWFKIRFVFTDGQLIDTVEMIDFAERKKFTDDSWKQIQDARLYIIKELIRRGHDDYII